MNIHPAKIKTISYVAAIALGVLVIIGLAFYLPRTNSDAQKASGKGDKKKSKKQNDAAKSGHVIEGGQFEASGVVQVPGTDGFLFVDDNNPGEVLWMRLDESGEQVGAAKSIPLGTNVLDPEGITSDGSSFYIIGSQSKAKGGNENALVRFGFDAATQQVTKAEAIGNLRDFLIEKVPELKDKGKGEGGGLNVEGLAWDPARQRLILGLRSPLTADLALAVALKLNDPQGAFSIANLALAEPNAIRLPVGGLGIRGIEYDDHLKSFLIIAGAAEQMKKTDFTVWEWNGESDNPVVRERTAIGRDLQPEGITPAKVAGSDFIFVICDTGRYVKLDYGAGGNK